MTLFQARPIVVAEKLIRIRTEGMSLAELKSQQSKVKAAQVLLWAQQHAGGKSSFNETINLGWCEKKLSAYLARLAELIAAFEEDSAPESEVSGSKNSPQDHQVSPPTCD